MTTKMTDEEKRQVNKEINSAIIKVNDEINELQEKKKIMQLFDFSKPVNEKKWEELCSTPLRESDALKTVVKSTFSEAENIVVSTACVFFDLDGYKIQIPTVGMPRIEIDTSWYKNDTGTPKQIYTPKTRMMLDYIAAQERNTGWYELAKIRAPFQHSKAKLFYLWLFKLKWEKIDKKYWKEKEETELDEYRKKVFNYCEERKEIKKHIEKITTEVLPKLEKFSKTHNGFQVPSGRQKTIAEIIELEKEGT